MTHDCQECHMKPGSDTARAVGCTCPIMDNGRGHNPVRMFIVEDCPIHGWAGKAEEKENGDGFDG